jgi:ClpP class serine protease
MRDILNGVWMMSEADANAMLPFVNQFLQGKEVKLDTFISSEHPYGYNSNETPSAAKVVIIPIKNTILKYDYCGNVGMLTIDALLKELYNDPKIGAIILDIDSGGGEASYMHNISETLQSFKGVKPTLTYYSGLCASAAYYLGCQTDRIYASSPTDRVGSIGTMITLQRANPDFKDSPYIIESIYASKSTAKNIAFEEALKGNPEPIKTKLLDPFNEQFIADVLTARPMINKDVFDGRDVMSNEAIQLGLIDGIKSLELVIEEAFSLIK